MKNPNKTTLLLAILFSGLLTGCSNSAHEAYYPVRPPELADCKIFVLSNDQGDRITVARCPNSTTTTTFAQGKTTASAVVIDGIEYTRKDKQP